MTENKGSSLARAIVGAIEVWARDCENAEGEASAALAEMQAYGFKVIDLDNLIAAAPVYAAAVTARVAGAMLKEITDSHIGSDDGAVQYAGSEIAAGISMAFMAATGGELVIVPAPHTNPAVDMNLLQVIDEGKSVEQVQQPAPMKH